MILQELLKQLQSDKAKTRLQTAQIIGMLDEVVANSALAARYRLETDPHVKEALKWAGKRLKAAQEAGCSTLEAIIDYFNVAAEWTAPSETPEEQALLLKLQREAEMRALQEQQAQAAKKALVRIAKGSMLGLPGLLMSGTPPPGIELDMLTMVYQSRIPVEQRRTLPTRPGDSDVSLLVSRMMIAADLNDRIKAAQILARDVNNPAALPALAQVFVEDRKQAVRAAAQEAGKHIYWNAVYWEIEQDGTLAAEIERRRAQVGIHTETAPQTTSQTDPNDIAEILRKAEAKRRKRKS